MGARERLRRISECMRVCVYARVYTRKHTQMRGRLRLGSISLRSCVCVCMRERRIRGCVRARVCCACVGVLGKEEGGNG